MRLKRSSLLLLVLGVPAGIIIAAFGILGALPVFYGSRVLPGVSVGNVAVGGLTTDEARVILSQQITPEQQRVSLAQESSSKDGIAGVGMVTADATAAELGTSLDVEKVLLEAYGVGRSPGVAGLMERFRLLRGYTVPPAWTVERSVLAAYLHQEFPHGFQEPKSPVWSLLPDGSFVYQPGEDGTDIVVDEVAQAIAGRMSVGGPEPVWFRVVPRPAPETAGGRVAGLEVARAVSNPLSIRAGDDKVVIPVEELREWVASATDGSAPRLDRQKIENSVRTKVVPALQRPARNAELAVAEDRATLFTPPTPGLQITVPATVTAILNGLAAGASTIQAVTKPVEPEVTTTSIMEQYGIRTLLARGETDFSGSPKNRIHNIRVGSQRYQGLLVPPGAEFSFNARLGPVDGKHGFLPELVIRHNVTTPEYGGGLCQVSTTMFRAAVLTGLPITARKNHAYAVSYYGTPGFDATIYPPSPDLRFVNDTPGHILIRMHQEGMKLAFEFWGTGDGRRVDVDGPVPFDRKRDGSVKARLARTVTKAGQTQRDEWLSVYKSPRLFPKVLAANAESETWEERVRRIAEKDRIAQQEFDRKSAEQKRQTQKSGTKSTPKPSPPEDEEEGGGGE